MLGSRMRLRTGSRSERRLDVSVNKKYFSTAIVMTGLALVAACSSDDDGNGSGAGDGSAKGDSGDGGTASADGSGGDGSGTGGGDSTGTGASSAVDDTPKIANAFDECAAEAWEAEAQRADILFMIDQSSSMTRTVPQNVDGAPRRWDLLRDAVLNFVESDEAKGLRVGLQFFPLPGNIDGLTCDVADYATPLVEIGALPANAQALRDEYPLEPGSGFTPSLPALEGALTHARDWGSQPENLDRGTAVVWVTDGFPTRCDGGQSDLQDLASSFNNPTGDEKRIPTFVIGLGPVTTLKLVAQAGGTGDGFFVKDNGDAVDSLLQALLRVANSPALCEFDYPTSVDGSRLDSDKVNMQFIDSNGNAEAVLRTDDAASCANNPGWYYDDADNPEKIHVCPSVCGNFGGGTVSIVAGCKTVSIF